LSYIQFRIAEHEKEKHIHPPHRLLKQVKIEIFFINNQLIE